MPNLSAILFGKNHPKLDDIIETVKKFKLVIYIYFIILVAYIIFFIFLKNWTYHLTSKSFAQSFSASLLEDLVFFLFVGSAVAIISTIISNKPPEDNEFMRRATSLANSDEAQKNDHVKEFLLRFLDNLAYFKKIKCFVTVKNYNENEEAFLIYLQREQILCNMYKDKVYIKDPSTVSIEADLNIEGSFGKLNYLHTFNTKTNEIIYKDCDETFEVYLGKGLNTRDFPTIVEPNSTTGLRFGYSTWQRSGDKTNKLHWIYFSASKFATNVEVSLKNDIKAKQPIKYEIRHFSFDNSSFTPIESGELHFGGQINVSRPNLHIHPNDRIECYICN